MTVKSQAAAFIPKYKMLIPISAKDGLLEDLKLYLEYQTNLQQDQSNSWPIKTRIIQTKDAIEMISECDHSLISVHISPEVFLDMYCKKVSGELVSDENQIVEPIKSNSHE